MNLPKIAVTLGDPAGIGAEIVLKALADPELHAIAEWMVVGDHAALAAVAPNYRSQLDPRIRLVDAYSLDPARPIRFGELSAEYGMAAVEYVRRATGMCLAGEADAMVTGPLNKEAVTLSGRVFSGHTEYIAELCGSTESRMLLASEKLSHRACQYSHRSGTGVQARPISHCSHHRVGRRSNALDPRASSADRLSAD